MNDTSSVEQPMEESPGAPGYASFVLRCWIGHAGHVRARLIDVHTGIPYLLGDLGDLPDLVRGLVAETAAGEEGPGIAGTPVDETSHSSHCQPGN